MRSARVTLAFGLVALAGAVPLGLSVHGARETHMGLERAEQMEISSLGDFLQAAAWETRVGLADLAFLEAGTVFHRGVRDMEEYHLVASPLRPWVPEHVHQLDSPQEMMPWIWLTTTLNPHHTRAYAMGGFFLSRFLDRPEEALLYLTAGEEHNPDDGLIPLTMGQILFTHLNAPEAAVAPLRRAVGRDFQDDEEAELSAVRYLAHALRVTGQWEEGLSLWEEQVSEHPLDEGFLQGRTNYIELVRDPETRESFTQFELDTADLAQFEDLLCPLGADHDHEGDPEPNHDQGSTDDQGHTL